MHHFSSLFPPFPALGCCAVMLPSLVVLQQYFKRRRALTSGIASVGVSLGALVIGPTYRVLIDNYGWRTTLVIHACVLLQAAIIGATYRPLGDKEKTERLPLEEKDEPMEDGQETEMRSQEKERRLSASTRNHKSKLFQMVDLSLFHNKRFLLYMTAVLGFQYWTHTMYTLGPSRAVSQGMDRFRASLLPSTIAVFSLVSRVINSLVANMNCCRLFVQLGVMSVGGGLAISLSCITSSFWGAITFCGLYGICCGRSNSPPVGIRVDACILKTMSWKQRERVLQKWWSHVIEYHQVVTVI